MLASDVDYDRRHGSTQSAKFDEFRLHTAYIRQLKQFDLELFSLQSNKRRIRSGGQFAGRSVKLT
jgi:hypothetical protein